MGVCLQLSMLSRLILQPFKLLDVVGLDTTSHIARGWQHRAEAGDIPKELVEPSSLLRKMVDDGKFGRKSGEGFYVVSRIRDLPPAAKEAVQQEAMMMNGQYLRPSRVR